MLSGDSAGAIEPAARARDLATELGWDTGRASALLTHGSARVTLGDAGGAADVEEAIEIARGIGALGLLSRAYNALGVVHIELADLRAASAARIEAARLSDQIGSTADARWYQGVLTEDHYRTGRWDEAVSIADDFLAYIDSGAEHYMTGQEAIVRSLIGLARGADAEALADAERAMAHGRSIDDPQVAHYLLPLGTYVLSVLGRTEAAALAREFLEVVRSGVELQFAVITLPAFAAAARRLGLDAELLDALAGYGSTPWVEATRAYAGGEFAAAADLLHRIGSLPDEAEARLRAAEQFAAGGDSEEARLQLGQASAFFRSVRAMRYENECEVLLAAAG
jgi:tetratricopeptide (TPR) repeat protein